MTASAGVGSIKNKIIIVNGKERMTLRYGLQSACDLFAKLKREVENLDNCVDSDHFFNFVVTAAHLREWIEKDTSLPSEVRQRLEKRNGTDLLAICNDISNASKHFAIRRAKVAHIVLSKRGFAAGRFGKGKFGIGEETIRICCYDGSELNALDLANQVIEFYASVFGDACTDAP